MRFEDFESLIAARGTNSDHWPDPTRAEYEPIRSWLASEQNLDEMLAGIVTPPLSANFQDQVIEALPSAARTRFQFGGLVAAGLACIFAAAVYFQTPSEDLAWQNAAEEVGLSDIYDWVMDDEAAQ